MGDTLKQFREECRQYHDGPRRGTLQDIYVRASMAIVGRHGVSPYVRHSEQIEDILRGVQAEVRKELGGSW